MSEPFIRLFRFTAPDAHTVEASIQDHQHHFEVTLTHDGDVVTSLSPRAVRWPWSTCAEAGRALDELVGRPVHELPRVDDAGLHCTHQLDLASSAVRFAGSGLAQRAFDVTVTNWGTPDGHAVIERDDGLRLVWRLDGLTITSPAPFAGQSIGAGFARWATAELDPDTAEAALILRRAVWVSPMRTLDLDALDVAGDSGLREGACYTAQPGRLDTATRNQGMTRVIVQPPSRQ